MKSVKLTDINSNQIVATGSRIPIDGNHQLVYYCNEISGSTLTNLGTLSGADLTLSGTYALDDKGLFSHGTNSLFLTGSSANDGAFNSSVNFTLGSTWTLEVVCDFAKITTFPDGSSNSNPGNIFEVADAGGVGGNRAVFQFNGSKLYAVVAVNGSYSVLDFDVPIYGSKVYLALTSDGTTLRYYVNGAFTWRNTFNGTFASNVTRIALGNAPYFGYPHRGHVAEARLSNVVRSSSYILSAATTINAM